MATYAIGDVQGCFDALETLLNHIDFNPEKDILWFTGDLVNRGPKSLETLRFVKQLGRNQHIVLGNHDLHLLALAHGVKKTQSDDTLSALLQAPDREELLNWLKQQPLLYHDNYLGYTMVHAGLAASWDLATAQALAAEVSQVIQGEQAADFFQHMYGNYPDQWQDDLQGMGRLRCITNYFTRTRFCYPDGKLELEHAEPSTSDHPQLIPWFDVPNRVNTNLKIIFGHWAALSGITHTPNTYALDTGCVWGYCLTAMRLEDEKRFSIPCQSSTSPSV